MRSITQHETSELANYATEAGDGEEIGVLSPATKEVNDSLKMSLFLIGLLLSVLSLKRAEPDHCYSEDITFELVTGFAYSDSEHILETKQGIVVLEDCIRRCRNHHSCYAVNYETGLCVLFDTKPNVDTGVKNPYNKAVHPSTPTPSIIEELREALLAVVSEQKIA
uniref:Apple domain-containing protein n=1 Tax=Timema shepardi TaxID=629360 RepID=A0A7R9ARI9_TIMSH|nr:unnamed protein product [Timema shepardi]